ncbi:Hypothetical protein, putative [Bodo saltans]|uniref:Uncharacterized protein n=1 Tax=Bodo saltans TaxID=75058 RepID=A0A0S4JKS7_BODSA|nr:Hypothetical protein, putative [Bodo saltans]|eukprot:CUG90780.1 Hypothetical protein, putative [Bodo saltans]
MWYIFWYRRRLTRKERLKKRNMKRALHYSNDPFDDGSSSETNHEPFAESPVVGRKGRKEGSEQDNDPFASCPSESDVDREPFSERAFAPSTSRPREPFEHECDKAFPSDESYQVGRTRVIHKLTDLSPYGTAFESSPYGGPWEEDDFSPSPRRPQHFSPVQCVFEGQSSSDEDDGNDNNSNVTSAIEVHTISTSSVAHTRWWWRRRLAESQ